MSKQAEAWMPLYVGDYLGGTQRLTTEQHGAYLLLILDYWRNGPAPDDDAVLQQITRLDRAAWKRHRPALAKMFQIVDGEWRHKRIDHELAAAQANQERRSSKAKAAAQARWGDARSNAPSMPEALPEECPPPSPSPKKSSEADASAAVAAPPAEPPKPLDVKAALFSTGVALLTGAGRTDAAARSLIGKWKQGNSDAAVLDAMAAAQAASTPDPVSFITARLRNRNDDQPRRSFDRPSAWDSRLPPEMAGFKAASLDH